MKIAVFDLDGTLVSSENTVIIALQSLFKKHDVKLEKRVWKNIRELIGLSAEEIVCRFFPNQKEEFYKQVLQDFEDEYYALIANNQHNLCYPYIKEELHKLHDKGWILAICTGKGRRGTEMDLENNNIASYFTLLKTFSDGYPSKPNPQILKAAIAECGGELKEAIMIGDTSYDIDMAHAIGVKSLAVLWGYHEKDSLLNANDFIDDSRDLTEKLEALYYA